MSKMSLKGGVEKGHLLHLNVKLSFKIDFMSMVLTYASGISGKSTKKKEKGYTQIFTKIQSEFFKRKQLENMNPIFLEGLSVF